MPSTPYLAIDIDVLRRNLATMAAWAAERGVALRPHAKTHKSLEIAALQLELGAVGLTVATIGEAEVFAAGGVDDLFIAYPIWADAARGARLRALAEQVLALRIGVDSIEAAEQLGRALARHVRSGRGRGRQRPSPQWRKPDDAVRGRAPRLDGPGSTSSACSPSPVIATRRRVARSLAAADEANALEAAVTALSRAGIEPRVCSGGSTPSLAFTDASVLNEVRPGVYVFNDAQQLELGSCEWPEIALTVAATVVSQQSRPVHRRCRQQGARRRPGGMGDRERTAARLSRCAHRRVVRTPRHRRARARRPRRRHSATSCASCRIMCCAAVNLADEYVVVSEGAEIDAVADRRARPQQLTRPCPALPSL